MMTPERWQTVKKLFNEAIAIDPKNRADFLSKVCGDDPDLRKEVETLLSSHEDNGSFLETPAFEVEAASISDQSTMAAGHKLADYRILSILGRGGMGEVYLAEDGRLGRKVALKFLPTAFTANQDRLARFEREARAASALNHPNILTIYEIGQADGRRFIATEYIEGQTLRQRLANSPLNVSETLNIATQVASALAAAHRAGIVHRDIKPENIMIRHDGYAKVVDFGLVKLTETPQSESQADTEPPTLALKQTDTGTIMGTTAYMSPEQARGQAVDARTDIWSLGAVIYEMLTARQPFEGATASDLIVSILERQPPSLSEVSPEIPERVEWLVNKALSKDRDGRYHSAMEMLTDLLRTRQRLEAVAPTPAEIQAMREKAQVQAEIEPTEERVEETAKEVETAPLFSTSVAPRRSWLIPAFIVLLLAGGLVGGYLYFGTKPAENQIKSQPTHTSPVVRTTQFTTWAGLDFHPSFSPDGGSIAYTSDRTGTFEIYVKQLTPGSSEIQLTSGGEQNFEPAWSPDGQMIAYHSKLRGGVWLVPALGGQSRQLTEFGSYPAWSADGSQIAFQSSGIGDDLGSLSSGALLPSTIWMVATQGGEPKQITQVGKPAGGHGSPSWSPDGKRISFAAYDPERTEIWTVTVADGQLSKITRGLDPVYAPDGKSIYFVPTENFGFGISRIPISETGEAAGEPTEIVSPSTVRVKRIAVTADGKKLSYSALTLKSNLWAVPLSPQTNEPSGSPVALTQDTSYRNSNPSFSPDGGRIAYHARRVGVNQDIWLLDETSTNPIQLTTNPNRDERPSWFPDGNQIAFISFRDGQQKLWSIDLNNRREKALLEIQQDMTFPELSPDGKYLLFNSKKSGTTNLWLVPIEGGEPKQLTFDQETMGFGCWSPDSRWIAFEIKRGDDTHLGLISSEGGQPVQLSFEPGQTWPKSFSPDGDKIAFAGFRNGGWNVWWISRSTKVQKQITDYSKLNAFVRYPAWSPRGDRIVYEYAETTGNIWLADLK